MRKRSVMAAIAMPVLSCIYIVPVVYAAEISTRQHEVAQRGVTVMPFDLEKTIHTFHRLGDGGRQTVTAKDAKDKKQIALIQEHLQHEAARFEKGDFGDPAKIHGEDMPGLKALQAGSGDVDVRYQPLADGGEVRYTAVKPGLVKAIHDWFGAQVSDHGRHARDSH